MLFLRIDDGKFVHPAPSSELNTLRRVRCSGWIISTAAVFAIVTTTLVINIQESNR